MAHYHLRLWAVVLTLALLGSDALGQTKTRADRTPLTFRDCGLYCNYSMWHRIEPETEGNTNMLPARRAASADSPWTFYIMQYNAPLKPRPDWDAATIREMAKNGKKVIIRAGIGRFHKNPNVDEMEQRLVNMFEEVDPAWLYAITLGEEQIYWNGWTQALTELYHRCKKRWPDLPVYQWWTPMVAPDVRAKSGWVALPADGWVLDLYGLPRLAFEKKLIKFLETGKPVVHIAWASPKWSLYQAEGTTSENWWNKAGRKVFDQQIEVCRAYNVPVAYFCCQQAEHKDGKEIAPIRWGWHAVDPEVRAWYRELEAMVMNLRTLPDDQIGFRTPDRRLFEWAHGSPRRVDLSYCLDDQGRKRFVWRSYLSKVPIKSGEYALETPYDNPHVRVTLMLDQAVSGLDKALAVRSIKGCQNRVPLVFRIDPRQPVEAMSVTANVTAVKALGGFANVSVSVDGTKWSEPIRNDSDEKTSRLTVASPIERKRDAPLWVRVTLEGLAGLPTNQAAVLNWLEVSASFEPAL